MGVFQGASSCHCPSVPLPATHTAPGWLFLVQWPAKKRGRAVLWCNTELWGRNPGRSEPEAIEEGGYHPQMLTCQRFKKGQALPGPVGQGHQSKRIRVVPVKVPRALSSLLGSKFPGHSSRKQDLPIWMLNPARRRRFSPLRSSSKEQRRG